MRKLSAALVPRSARVNVSFRPVGIFWKSTMDMGPFLPYSLPAMAYTFAPFTFSSLTSFESNPGQWHVSLEVPGAQMRSAGVWKWQHAENINANTTT